MIALDLFCGAGGLTKGLTAAGVNVRAAVDIDLDCRASFQENNVATYFARDIRFLAPGEVEKFIGRRAHNDLLIAACAPCQPFAQLNRSRPDSRAFLLSHVARLIRDLRPRAILIENVPGLRRVRGFSTYKRFTTALIDIGYSVASGVLDAKDFGVPQTRRRFVLLAVRGKRIQLPVPTHGAGLHPYRTVRDAIAHYPPISAGEIHPIIANHVAASVSATNAERLRHTPKNGGSRADWPKRLWLTCHSRNPSAHTDSYGRMAWDLPAPALTCKCHSISNGRYAHPEQNRAISLREAAALQGFPEDYQFFGNGVGSIARQIGNAVPIPFAQVLGEHILEVLNQ